MTLKVSTKGKDKIHILSILYFGFEKLAFSALKKNPTFLHLHSTLLLALITNLKFLTKLTNPSEPYTYTHTNITHTHIKRVMIFIQPAWMNNIHTSCILILKKM